jgi:hypothetical protein
LLLALTGCGLPLADRDAELANTCDSDEACGAGAVCNAGICVSTQGELEGLIVQIDIPPGAALGSGTSSLVLLDTMAQGTDEGGLVRTVELRTRKLVDVTQSLSLENFESHPRLQGCDALDKAGTIQMALELQPVAEAAGIPLPTYTGESDPSAESNAVTLTVPEDKYRAYLRPLYDDPITTDVVEESRVGCEIPPALFATLDTGSSNVMLTQPTSLTGNVLAATLSLQDWKLDMVDKDTGRVISTVHTFPEGADHSFDLLFWNEIVTQQQLDPVIRLTPPESAALAGMPVVFWHLSSVGILGYDNIELNIEQLAGAVPVNASISVFDGVSSEEVPATVVVQSISLLDNFGDNISFKTTLTEPNAQSLGTFSATLLPGKYAVVAIPSGGDLAVTYQEIDIVHSEAYTLQMQSKAHLTGAMHTPQGGPAYGMPVFVQPSAAPPQNYLQSQFNSSELQPTNATSLTLSDGSFSLAVDPGTGSAECPSPGWYDLFVRPSESSGMPWFVRARLTITATPDSNNLRDQYIGHPVVLAGNVLTDDAVTIPGATIRAWLPLDKCDGAPADAIPTAIQIAETTADASGRYRLLLPPSISQ